MVDPSPIRVSYIIATKNRAKYLERTLANIREFKDSIDELIIIDGASSDNTRDVVGRNSDIVSIFVSEPDCGEGHAFNKALFQSRGRYVKPITDDDYFYPDAMRQLIAIAEENPDCDAIQTGGEYWAEVNGRLELHSYCRVEDVAPTQRQVFFMCHYGLGLLVRRTALVQIGGSSPSYRSVDGDIHCKLVEAGCRVRYLDINLFRWHVHKHSISHDQEFMQYSWLMFDLRLRNFREFYLVNPYLVARTLGLEQVPHGVGLQHAIYYSARLSFSRYGAILDGVPAVFKLLGAIKRSLTCPLGARGRKRKVAVPSLPEKSPFTGMLRE